MTTSTRKIPKVDALGRRRIENAARIYDAAMKLLRRRTWGSLTVDEICKEAEVGRATSFRAYDSKAGLLLEFNRRLTSSVQQRLARDVPADATRALQIVADEIAETWTQAGRGAVEMARDFLRSPGSADVHTAHPELLELVVGVVRHGAKTGQLRGIQDVDLAGSLALVQIAVAAASWLEHQRDDLKKLVNEAWSIWLHGAMGDPL